MDTPDNILFSHSTKMYQVKGSCRYWQITFSHVYTTTRCVISLPKVIISTFAWFTELHHERAVFMRFLPTLYFVTSARGVQLSITKPCALCKCVQGLPITCYNWFPRQYRKQYCLTISKNHRDVSQVSLTFKMSLYQDINFKPHPANGYFVPQV